MSHNNWSLLLVTLCCVQLCNGLAYLVKLDEAVKDGARCLDGTPPAYYYRKGYGSGANKWIVHLEGGGWCTDITQCTARSKTLLGSTTYYTSTYSFGGLLSDNEAINANFFNWNMVFVVYCDGASFLGNVDKPVPVANGTNLYFRGFKNLQAVLKSLETLKSKEATDFILTGCSAGGIATYIHADYVHTKLSQSTKYAAIADAGYFINARSIQGEYTIEESSKSVLELMNTSTSLDSDCIKAYSADELWKCIVPQYTYPYISSPMFSINSFYDTWQLENELKLNCLPPYCTEKQMAAFYAYGEEFLEDAKVVLNSKSNGVWFDSCLQHCQTLDNFLLNKVKVQSQTFSETISYWYNSTGTGKTKVVDCRPYGCNDSC